MKLLDSPSRGLMTLANDIWLLLWIKHEMLPFFSFSSPFFASPSLSYRFSSSDTKPPFHNFSFYFLGPMQVTPVSQLLILVVSSTSAFLDRGCSFHLNAPRSHGCGPGITKFSLRMTLGRCLTLQVSHSEKWIKRLHCFEDQWSLYWNTGE